MAGMSRIRQALKQTGGNKTRAADPPGELQDAADQDQGLSAGREGGVESNISR